MLHALGAWLVAGSPPHWLDLVGTIAFVLIQHLEWWLPRTNAVKARSLIEAFGNAAMPLVRNWPFVSIAIRAMATPDHALPLPEKKEASND
jgi:hypothetical protein